MTLYHYPEVTTPEPIPENQVVLVASGDLRQSANEMCWPAQQEMESRLREAFRPHGFDLHRGHQYDPQRKHGFIWNQRMGMDVFRKIHPRSRVVVAEAVWQYSHHLLPGLRAHQGPILTVANWSGQWPGLVGLLNLNASLTKAGVRYDSLWSADFTDDLFVEGLRRWLDGEPVNHDINHVKELQSSQLDSEEARLGKALARELREKKAILGVFDEGCMGMYNAIIDDELLNPLGVYKERLSQSALVAAMRRVSKEEAGAVKEWLVREGLSFKIGSDPQNDLTEDQITEQCKMYIAALRIAEEFSCDAIGIQYQQGLKDMTPASDLVEGLLNNSHRPPGFSESGDELFRGRALPHFNEVDECAGLDALLTHRVWNAMGLVPDTTLHDLRWGEHYQGEGIDDFVWVFMISGAAPASHFEQGYRSAMSERQPPMYFPLGGGTLKGVSKPGEIVWSRIFIEQGTLCADLGRGRAISLAGDETERRWQATTPQWPIMHGVLYGVTRDQMMARHKSNHLNVVYADSTEAAERAFEAKAAMLLELGIKVFQCGDRSSRD